MKIKITCTVCGKSKKESSFSPVTLKSGKNICKYCNVKFNFDTRIQKDKLMLRDAKVRKCLKCDKKFRSICGYRICNGCKTTAAWLSGGSEL